MRTIVALSILLLGANSAAPEVEYASLIGAHFQTNDDDASLIEIESSTGRSDRLTVAALQASEAPPQQTSDAASDEIGTADIEVPPNIVAPVAVDSTESASQQPGSLDDLCNALLTSAQDNDLPVPFFANLIWQESGLNKNSVSSKGALGIAQFMPQTAAESGLHDPFDPHQAIPASARLLHELREQFGNLGFAAAAYNAGPGRVLAWLANRQGLPRETRDYVVRITGRSAEDWRKTPPDDAALTFTRQLPCRSLPAFASVEETSKQQEEAAQEAKQVQDAVGQVQDAAKQTAAPEQATKAQDVAGRQNADHEEPQPHLRWGIHRFVAHMVRAGWRRAALASRGSHEGSKRAEWRRQAVQHRA